MTNEEIENLHSGLSIKLNFIVESVFWRGSFCERLVTSLRKSLKSIHKKLSISVQELEVTVIEVGASFNSRHPIYIFSDPRKAEILAPGHFLTCK